MKASQPILDLNRKKPVTLKTVYLEVLRENIIKFGHSQASAADSDQRKLNLNLIFD